MLLAFCRTCCADVFAANGRVDAAEEELVAAIKELTAAGQQSRCVNPAARLAEIRVFPGRFDEAEELLAGFDGEPGATRPAVALRLALGEPEPATALLERRLDEVGRRTCSPFRSWSSWSMRGLPRDDSSRQARRRTI